MPPEQVAGFDKTYEEKLEPLLKGYGVVESNRPIRTEIDSAFSRLYEFESPAEAAAMMEAFRGDPEWFEQWRKLGLIRGAFSHYETPAGPGKDVGAGEGQPVLAGRGRALWRNYDGADGLPVTEVRSIVQDTRGHLWFGSWGGGVSRYDGRAFSTYTKNDVLWRNIVYSVVADREGNIWIPDGRRVSLHSALALDLRSIAPRHKPTHRSSVRTRCRTTGKRLRRSGALHLDCR